VEKNGSTSSSEWLVESLRWTSFLPEPVGAQAAAGWWSSLMGGQPEASINRQELGLQQQEGPCGPGRLTLFVARTGRVDFALEHCSESEYPDHWPFCRSCRFFPPSAIEMVSILSCDSPRRSRHGADSAGGRPTIRLARSLEVSPGLGAARSRRLD
jgi:hypothetical protein